MSKEKRIFITGASGFIGKNLLEYLREGGKKYKLFFPYHKELDLMDTDKVRAFLKKNNINIVVHCANVGGSRKTNYDLDNVDIVQKNLKMFFNLAEGLRQSDFMIHIGTGAEYDKRHYLPKMREDYFGRYIPEDAYSFSKYICSKFIEKSSNLIGLRLFGVFGKYEDYRFRFISNSIVKNLFGLPIVINQNVFFDYLYVDDLVKIIEYFIGNKVRYKFYNVATSSTIDLLTIANKINKIADKPSEIIIKNPGLNSQYSADNIRLRQELKGFDFTPFDIALRELYNWYKDNIEKIDSQAVKEDEYIKYCKTKY
ncbi:MAG: NAD(P)-dependent oxidoreductase [Candidatus Omnitrophota bacterium]